MSELARRWWRILPRIVEWSNVRPLHVGPSELARWQVTFNFAEGNLSIGKVTIPMMLSETRHPILEVAGEGWSMSQWETPELQHLRERLQGSFQLGLDDRGLGKRGR